MENITTAFLLADEDFDNCYIFSPNTSRRKIINGKVYYVQSYFNGNKDFESTMKRFATNNYY